MKVMHLRQPAGLDNLHIVDLPDPGLPGPGQIRVNIKASSLNFHDLAVALGYMPVSDGRIPLSDGAGIVEAVGPGVSEFSPGDAVVSTFFPGWLDGSPLIADFSTTPGDGVNGYAREYVVSPTSSFTRAPQGYSHHEAATLTTAGVTAWRALVVNGRLKAGDTVLLLGTGGVSIFALQLAKAMGATVILTSSSDEKLEKARDLGADYTINYRQVPEWAQAVLDITNGRGVDHVVEVGGAGTLSQSILATKVGGHIALIGVLTGGAGPVPTAALMARQIRLQGLVVGNRQHQKDLIRAIDASGFRPIIDTCFDLSELGAAFAHQKDGKHFGKLCVTVG